MVKKVKAKEFAPSPQKMKARLESSVCDFQPLKTFSNGSDKLLAKTQKTNRLVKNRKTSITSEKSNVVKAKKIHSSSDVGKLQPLIKDVFQASSSTRSLILKDNKSDLEKTVTKRRKMPFTDIPVSFPIPENETQRKKLQREKYRETTPFYSVLVWQNLNDRRNVKNDEVVCELPSPLGLMFEASMEEGETEKAIDFLMSVISKQWYPSLSAVNSIITSILMSENEDKCRLLEKASTFLSHLLQIHPPISLEMKCFYLHALCLKKSAWEMTSEIIQNSLVKGNTVLLVFVVELIEANFFYFTNDSKELPDKMAKTPSCILASDIFWNKKQKGTVNDNCRELLQYFAKSIESGKCYEAQLLLQRLICVVAECLRLTASKSTDYLGSNCIEFAKVFSSICSDIISNLEHLKIFLLTLNPVWLRYNVTEQFIGQFSAKIFSIPFSPCRDLADIVRVYMDVAPHFQSEKKEQNFALFKSRVPNRVEKESGIRPEHVNRRNCKGETLLHTACAQNRVNYMTQLLETPGIDVNIKDYAGWTPLHEACIHGNIECVNTLLSWANSSTDSVSDHLKLNVFASNNDGITPLHDAVMNNHMNVARALLKYGGKQLLEMTTTSGFTALDLARSSEMKSFLTSFRPSSPRKPFTPKKVKKGTSPHVLQEDCCRYLMLLSYFLDAYVTKNRIKQVATDLKRSTFHLNKAVTTSKKGISEALRKVAVTTVKDNPTVEDVLTFSNDLHVFLQMATHIKKLETSLEIYFGRKNCFKSEITTLEFICLL